MLLKLKSPKKRSRLSLLLIPVMLLLFPIQTNPQTNQFRIVEVRPIPPALVTLQNQILKNNPGLTTGWAMALASAFDDSAKRHNVSSRLLAAIAMQESGYTADAQQCYVIRGKVRCDYCLMQINDRTLKNLHISVKDLMASHWTCIEAGATVLSDLKHRYAKRDKAYWTRYNAVNPLKRATYKQLVERFL